MNKPFSINITLYTPLPLETTKSQINSQVKPQNPISSTLLVHPPTPFELYHSIAAFTHFLSKLIESVTWVSFLWVKWGFKP